MGLNSNLIETIKKSFSSSSVEGYYNDKLLGKLNLSYDSISDYEGDDILRMELFLINYVENFSYSLDFNDFVKSVEGCFHNISVNYFRGYYFDNNHINLTENYSYLKSDYITNRLKYIRFFNKFGASGNYKLGAWNNRLSYLYVVVKHLDSVNFESHCDHCKNLSNLLETSSIHNLVVLFSLVNKIKVLESIFIYLFEQLSSFYWNNELLLTSFTNLIVKNVVKNSIEIYQLMENKQSVLIEILKTFLIKRNNYLDHKYPHMELFMKILGNFAMYLSIYNSDLRLMSDLDDSKFTNLFISLILLNIVQASNTADLNHNYLNNASIGLKNQRNSEFIYLKIFVESFMKSFSENVNKGGEVASKMSKMNSFLDWDTYMFIINLKFRETSDQVEKLHSRIGVILLYMIAIHNQITSIRLNEVTYMRLLYSLPWSPAIQFCTQDVQLKYILPDFKNVIMECFGTEIFICNIFHVSITYILNDFTTKFINKFNQNKFRDHYYIRLFSFSKLLSNSLVLLNKRINYTNGFYFATNILYYTISNWLFKNRLLMGRKSEENQEKIETITHSLEWNWFSHYLRISYLFNKSTSYLGILDSLILNFILEESQYKDENLTLEDIFTSTYLTDTKLELQRNLSSNFLSLNQNPLNLIMRIPVQVIQELIKFRMFGNLFVLLLSKLNKYIYEGIPSLLATRLEIDFFQLSALQSASLVNILMEISIGANKKSIKKFRSLILSLLSKNNAVYNIISSSGLPKLLNSRFINELFPPDLSLITSLENFSYFLKLTLEGSEDWDKSEIQVKKDGNTIKSLEPSDNKDIALFHLYNIHIISMEYIMSKENYENSKTFLHIDNLLNVFWEFIGNFKGEKETFIFKSWKTFIVKIHYLHPSLIKKSAESISNIIEDNSVTKEVRDNLREITELLKIIEYNNIVLSNNNKKI